MVGRRAKEIWFLRFADKSARRTSGPSPHQGRSPICGAGFRLGEVAYDAVTEDAPHEMIGAVCQACIVLSEAGMRQRLREAAPDGIDVYFDNVGGEHLEAAIGALRMYGRVALCGSISNYNATDPQPGPNNLTLAVGKRLTLRGYIVTDHNRRMKDYLAEMSGWLRDGAVRYEETVVDGLENAPAAFMGLLAGENLGKMVVRI